MTLGYLDRAPPGWFALDVMRQHPRKRDRVALMVSVDPNDLKHCTCDFPALFYVHPDDYRPGDSVARQCWLRIPGRHKDRESAMHSLQDVMAQRH